MAKYRWAKRASGRHGNAQEVGEYLEGLRKKSGGNLTPHQVVAAAQSPRSPIHGAFVWDDRAAAAEHRLWQARKLIGAIEVVTIKGKTIRQYVSVEYDDGTAYAGTEEALSDAELRKQVLARALDEAERWRQRYEDMAELAEICKAIQRAKKQKRRKAA